MATQDISSVIKKQIEQYGDNSSMVDPLLKLLSNSSNCSGVSLFANVRYLI